MLSMRLNAKQVGSDAVFHISIGGALYGSNHMQRQ